MAEWIPQPGEVYQWAPHTVRRKDTVIEGVVISYDPVKKLIRGRLPNGMLERRHLVDVEPASPGDREG